MSLILEALKKSERERLGNAASVPLVTRPSHALLSRNIRRRRQSRVVIVMTLLLVVAALAVWLLTERQDNTSSLDQAREAGSVQLPQASVVESPPVSAPQAVPSPQVQSRIGQLQEPVETPLQGVPAETAVNLSLQQVQAIGPVSEPVIEPVAEPVMEDIEIPEPPAQLASPPQETEVVPAKREMRTFRQLPSSLRNSLKPMHLDVHVYDRRESRRFVYISGRLYNEGAKLKNGAELIEIVPSGVVMRINGEQFLLTVND